MNKNELIVALAQRTDLSKKDAEKAVLAVMDIIKETLTTGEKVSLVGFGTFEAKKRAARMGHNPATNAQIEIPASVAPTFKAGKSLKEALNN